MKLRVLTVILFGGVRMFQDAPSREIEPVVVVKRSAPDVPCKHEKDEKA